MKKIFFIFVVLFGLNASAYGKSAKLDIKDLTWSDAFVQLTEKLEREYAFGAHKKIPWQTLYAEYISKIRCAEEMEDVERYYLALRGYLHSLKDGHIELQARDRAQQVASQSILKAIGYGFGIGLTQIAENTVVAFVLPNSPAEKVGLQAGDIIITWNGKPIAEALQEVDLTWADSPIGSSQKLHQEQLRLLTRTTKEAFVEIDAWHPHSKEITHHFLESYDDQLSGLERQSALRDLKEGDEVVTWKLLNDKIGYMEIRAELDVQAYFTLISMSEEQRSQISIEKFVGDPVIARFQTGLSELLSSGIEGLIIDLRDNHGGPDYVSAAIAAHFLPNEQGIYEVRESYHEVSQRFEIDEVLRFPQVDPIYTGPIAVLISEGTFSSGEGLAMALQLAPQATLFGFEGTAGAFGSPDGTVYMPGGFTVKFPDERGVDLGGNVLIEGNDRLEGGVQPDVLIPRTEQSLVEDQVLFHAEHLLKKWNLS